MSECRYLENSSRIRLGKDFLFKMSKSVLPSTTLFSIIIVCVTKIVKNTFNKAEFSAIT